MTEQRTGATGQPITAEHLRAYAAQLRAHDWTHGDSDDADRVERGRDEREALVEAQKLLDADLRIWNSIAPPAFVVHVVPGQRVAADPAPWFAQFSWTSRGHVVRRRIGAGGETLLDAHGRPRVFRNEKAAVAAAQSANAGGAL